MGLPWIKQEVLRTMDQLPDEEQRQVLDFVQALARKTPQGKPGSVLLRHAGALPPEELDRMSSAIEEACEQINPDAW